MSCCRRRRRADPPALRSEDAGRIRPKKRPHYHRYGQSTDSSAKESLSLVGETTDPSSGAPVLQLDLPRPLRPESVLWAFARSTSSSSLANLAIPGVRPSSRSDGRYASIPTVRSASPAEPRKSALLSTPTSAKWFFGGPSRPVQEPPGLASPPSSPRSTDWRRGSYSISVTFPPSAMTRSSGSPSMQVTSLSERKVGTCKLPPPLILDESEGPPPSRPDQPTFSAELDDRYIDFSRLSEPAPRSDPSLLGPPTRSPSSLRPPVTPLSTRNSDSTLDDATTCHVPLALSARTLSLGPKLRTPPAVPISVETTYAGSFSSCRAESGQVTPSITPAPVPSPTPAPTPGSATTTPATTPTRVRFRGRPDVPPPATPPPNAPLPTPPSSCDARRR